MSLAETLSSASARETPLQEYIYRIDLLPKTLELAETITCPGLTNLITYPVFWLKTDTPNEALIETIASELLVDPLIQKYVISSQANPDALLPPSQWPTVHWILEKQFLPGVTDNLGKTVEKSICYLLPSSESCPIEVASGQAYWITDPIVDATHLLQLVQHQLFNPLVQTIFAIHYSEASTSPLRYHFPQIYTASQTHVEKIPLDVDDEALMQLSKSRNLALTLKELHTIRDYYRLSDTQAQRQQKSLPPWPTDVELEIIAQTWSEHCKHKIFASKIEYTDASDPDSPVTLTIDSLFKTFIAGSTQKLMEKRPDLLSVFKDNAGVLRWSDEWGVCFKVETHNSPSALEPYGGALTGIVGVNRDILGTGLGAKPLFNTNVFCFAHPDEPYVVRPTMLPPEAILTGVRKGVEDGGNKSGIPTVNGSVFFDSRYRAKPLVFCGTGGILPLEVHGKAGYEKFTTVGDTIVMAGGRVGKDGIHGATFSSEALNKDSPVSAVQIGDPITQKRMLDFIIEARDKGLISGITDNGAGGLSSSVGEMAELTQGATLHLEKVPLKYPGLAPYEIMISESQERMTISTNRFSELQQLAQKHDVEVTAIGEFHNQGTLDIYHHGALVGSLSLEFLHHGLCQMELKAFWHQPKARPIRAHVPTEPEKVILQLLQHPNICSREALIRQYDHEVQGRSVIKPLMGPTQTAPCDAAVIQPLFDSCEGLVISNGLCPQYSDWDTYAMACCAIDEAVRNAVAVGADPRTIALLDNFCWPDPLPSNRNPDAEHKLAQLVRACQALYDMALSYETPFISGKDSMKNDFDDGTFRLSIPPTLLISAIGKIPDIHKAVSMDFKRPGDKVFLLGKTNLHMGGTEYYNLMGWYSQYCPRVNTLLAKQLYQTLFKVIQQSLIRSCHDLSEGGLAIALAECALGSGLGVNANIDEVVHDSPELRWDEVLFSETPSRFIISVSAQNENLVRSMFKDAPLLYLGQVTEEPVFHLKLDDRKTAPRDCVIPVESLLNAWRCPPAQCYASGVSP